MGRVRRRLLVLLGLLALSSAGLAAPAAAQLPIPTITPTADADAHADADADGDPGARAAAAPGDRAAPPRAGQRRVHHAPPAAALARTRAGRRQGRRVPGRRARAGPARRGGLAHARGRGARARPRPSPARRGRPTWCGRGRAPSDSLVYGPTASSTVVVPIDERDRRVKRSRGWRKQRRPGAWNGGTLAASSSRATAKLRFTQRRVRVIVRRFPSAGRLAVSLDGRRTVIGLAGPAGHRQVAFDSGPPGRRRPPAHRAPRGRPRRDRRHRTRLA